MTEAISLAQDESRSLILNFLSMKQEKLSARELSEALDLPMPTVSRLLNSLRSSKPAIIQLTDGKYEFVGNINDLPLIPDGYENLFRTVPSTTKSELGESDLSDIDISRVGPVGHQILEHLTVKNKVPLSGVIRKFNLEEDEAGFILEELESQDLVSKEHMDNFDEDCFSIMPKGKVLIEQSFAEPSNVFPFQKTASQGSAEKTETPKAAQEVAMTEAQRTFEMPSFEDIPEENASGRGRPTGDRDYENLRVCMLGYIEEHEPCAKSKISHTLPKLLTNFGRQTIASEVDVLVDHGYVKAQISGKREVFSLTPLGKEIVAKVRNGEAIEPLVPGGSVEASTKPKAATQPKKQAVQKQVSQPKPEMAEVQKKPNEVKSVPQTAVQRPQEAAAPSAPSVSSVDLEKSDLQKTVNDLLARVPGETSYQLRYCFDQMANEINRLKHKNTVLNNMNRILTEEL